MSEQGDPRPDAIPIDRRILIRGFINECREADTTYLALPVDEIEVLLNHYERGGFRT